MTVVRTRLLQALRIPAHRRAAHCAYAWLYARANGGTFILRIEDTDENVVEGSIELIYRTLKQAGLYYDEAPTRGDYGPYIQSQRKGINKKYAESS
jgi:glutamyl-tRNA synthetase